MKNTLRTLGVNCPLGNSSRHVQEYMRQNLHSRIIVDCGNRSNTGMDTITIENGKVLKGEKDLEDHATKFYKTLYLEHEQIENNHQAKVQCLKTVSQLVMEDQNIAFTAKVTKEELHSPIKALLMNKLHV